MENRSITVNRKELYEQVWNVPVSRLAPKYGISDVGLKKICRKLNVPTPPLGYWAKIQHNIKVEKTPLPRLKHGEPHMHTIRKMILEMKTNSNLVQKLKRSFPNLDPLKFKKD